MAINYLQRVQARRNDLQQPNDVERGIQVGQSIGKLLGGLSEAIKSSQKDALANKLMDQQSISSQPGAGVTQDLGTLPADTRGGGDGVASDDQLQQAMAASRLSLNAGQSQDLGTLPSDSPMTPGPTGTQVMPDESVSDDQLQQAMVASRLGGGPTVSFVSPPGGPQPNAAPSSTPASTSGDFSLSGFSRGGGRGGSVGEGAFPGGGSAGSGTVGGLIHTGGVQELDLQKEILAMQNSRATAANAQQEAALRLADLRAKASGTGPYALDAATKRAQLLEAQTKALNPKTAVIKPEDMPITNLDSEPVNNQGQLNKYVDTTYGKGSSGALASTVMNPETIDNPKFDSSIPEGPNNPKVIPNPNGPQVSADGQTVTVGPKNKRITMPIGTAQTLIKQQNSLNFKQNQPLLRVPGEDQTQGSQTNPYPIKTKLDMMSRMHGTWVRLPPSAQFPNGQIAQVP